jgi:hypothetical protein
MRSWGSVAIVRSDAAVSVRCISSGRMHAVTALAMTGGQAELLSRSHHKYLLPSSNGEVTPQLLCLQVYGECTCPTEQWRPKAFPRSETSGGRYLWSDAFGVCNYLTLSCETGEPRWVRG